MTATLATIDIIIIAAYFAAVLMIGFLSGRRGSGSAEFLLAGRSLTLPIFVMTLVSTWYGGILGVGEFSYLYGISNWVVQGLPYYVFALVFAVVLAKRIRASNLVTIPDKLNEAYGLRASVFGSFLTVVLMTPAPYVLMLAILLQVVTGWGLVTCVLIGTVATTAYLFTGGFSADVNTDVFEFILMFAGFAVVIPFAYAEFGGMEFIAANVPATHLTWHGGNSPQFIAVWFFIALWTLVDPAFHQRCYAAKSGEVAQRGIIVSIVFWFVFDAMTATAGLYARAILPKLDEPMMAFPLLAEVTLPAGAKAVFYVGMLATIMSSLNTLAFISATTVGRDIVWRLRGDPDDRSMTGYIRMGLLLTAVLSVILSLTIPSVIKLWYIIGTTVIPGLLVPLVTSYFGRLRVRGEFALGAMVLGWGTSTIWLLAGWWEEFGSFAHYPLGIEPMFPGLLISLLVWGVGLRSERV